jgi:hypothetical protein
MRCRISGVANSITRSDVPERVAYKPAPSKPGGKASALARALASKPATKRKGKP